MKKRFCLATVIIAICSLTMNAQVKNFKPCDSLRMLYEGRVNELTSQRDSVQALFNDALIRLDTIVGVNITFNKQLDDRNAEFTQMKKELLDMLKKKNNIAAELAEAKKMISA